MEKIPDAIPTLTYFKVTYSFGLKINNIYMIELLQMT